MPHQGGSDKGAFLFMVHDTFSRRVVFVYGNTFHAVDSTFFHYLAYN